MDELKTYSTSNQTADVDYDFLLGLPTETTRKIFRATIVNNQKEPEANVRGHIIHQRKKKSDIWEDIQAINLNNLKGGEGVRFELKCAQIKDLYDAIKKCKIIANKGISFGEKEYEVFEKDKTIKIIEVKANRESFIRELVGQNYSEEMWKEILSVNPDLATKLSWSKIQSNRQKALSQFEENINKDKPESFWQKYFEDNTWIFGYGLNYQFLNRLTDQPNFGGATFDGKNSQKGDFLLDTVANAKFTVLVEIKKPTTNLVTTKKQYRNGSWLLGAELYGSVSQIQVYLNTWDTEGSKNTQNLRELEKENIFTYLPKGIIVIGNTNQLDDADKLKSFELFRRNLHNPEIITFDELFERAKFIVGITKIKDNEVDDESEYDDVPF